VAKQFKLKLVRSLIGCTQQQRDAVRCLGLKHREHEVVVKDNPAIRGNIMKVQHLVTVRVEGQ
jgi:large subunit ribosomal protein L30